MSNEAEITNELLAKMQRLRKRRESVGVECFASEMLEAFRESRSAEDRDAIWNGFLEVLSEREDVLSDLGFSDWVNELLMALSDPDRAKRLQALGPLTDIAEYLKNNDDVIGALVRCLYDNSKAVRNQAVYAVERFASPQIIVALANSLTDRISHGAASDDPDKTILWHGAFALDQVIDRSSLNDNERDYVAERLLRALLRVISEPDRSVLDIWKIGDSLGEHVKGKRALAILIEMFAHPSPSVRDSAVHGLGHLGGPEAVRLINLALGDPAAEVRDEARRAIDTLSA
ncbi:MAG TPA: HEAT repeat domain-containing protein [Pyrinomonadaceae bacterium]|jgi:HEAT repeat protein